VDPDERIHRWHGESDAHSAPTMTTSCLWTSSGAAQETINRRSTTMSDLEYASRARSYYRDFLPGRYQQIPNPEHFFSDLGQRIENQV